MDDQYKWRIIRRCQMVAYSYLIFLFIIGLAAMAVMAYITW